MRGRSFASLRMTLLLAFLLLTVDHIAPKGEVFCDSSPNLNVSSPELHGGGFL